MKGTHGIRKRFDIRSLGLELKCQREKRHWTQEYVSRVVDRTARTIMSIENKGQHPSLDLFYQLVTLFHISVDQYFYPEQCDENQDYRNRIAIKLQDMDYRELAIMEATADGILDSREMEAK